MAFAASGAGEGKEKKSDTDRLIDELKNINPTESVQDIANTLKAILKLAQDIYDHTVGVVKGALGSTAQAVANDRGEDHSEVLLPIGLRITSGLTD